MAVPDAGTAEVLIRSDLIAGQADGEFVIILERSPTVPPGSATGQLGLGVDGSFIGTIPYAF